MTGYNWETNASNAGNDYINNSDYYLISTSGISDADKTIPGIVTTTFHENALNYNAYSLATLQMAGYVAKDTDGPVTEAQTAPSSRWAEVKAEKGSSLSLTPDITDNYVYMDEYVNYLVNNLGYSNQDGIKGYVLDNEPALWPSTHPRIHPNQTLCAEVVNKGIATAKVVKNIDSTAEIFGPALYGFAAYTDFQGAPDWNTVKQGKSYDWFIDYYLDKMKEAGTQYGKRLLNVLDVHWYPEAQGDNRITESNATTENDKLARVQAPRTLWDKTYKEKSWIGDWGTAHLPLIPKLMASINKYYPGTKLSFTEFTYGGENHITGAIAVDDVLGIFAKYGVYFGALWPVQDNKSYLTAAYKIYRNYDDNNSAFGNYYVFSKTSDSVNTSVFTSINLSGNEIHVIAINKNLTNSCNCNFNIACSQSVLTGKVWYIDGNGADIKNGTDISNIQNNSFTYELPAASVSHFVLQTNSILDVKNDQSIPSKFDIEVYPNPFNSSCRLEYSILGNGTGTLEIFDVIGRKIKSFDQIKGKGELNWNGANENNIPVSSGVYFAVLKGTDQKFVTRKIMLLK
jgi:hypothetical protein